MRLLLLILLSCLACSAAAEERFFDAGGVRIRYLDTGAGVPVVLVHGFTANIERAWIETGMVENLARDYRVIALDLRGHGKSDKPHEAAAYDALAFDVVRLMDHLRIDRAHAVGYSLGGIILAKLLTTHPQRFLSAVLGGAAYRRSQGADADQAADAAAREIEAGIYRALVRVPSLAVVGEADPALPRVKAMVKRWPGLALEVVPGATHPTVHAAGCRATPVSPPRSGGTLQGGPNAPI
jgi:pimeloyl-ACP methyl ester carboxylesterase